MTKNRIKNKEQALEEATLTSVKNDYDRVKRLVEIENATEKPTNWDEIQLFLAPTNLQIEVEVNVDEFNKDKLSKQN